ncbi:uncharacterized protein [Diadema setosum]|uniref:uncharacterized protein n=1 Tax=Diadema setosum TaxID=31175 RepID=UPI003B3B4FC1
MADRITQETTPESEEIQANMSVGKTQEKKKKKKKRVKVTVGTTGGSELIAGLIALLRSMDDVVKSVNFREIPYNIADMEQLQFSDVGVFILCHSINNRRLSITDVTDALYDRLLRRARRKLGKSKMNIVAYDFKSNDLQADALATKLESFKIQQPTACRKTSAVVFAGQCASSPPELPQDQLEKLQSSLQAAASPPLREKVAVFFNNIRPTVSCGSSRH